MAIATSLPFPFGITSEAGLRFEFNANGSIRRIDRSDIMINMYLGNEVEGSMWKPCPFLAPKVRLILRSASGV
jgi:hypothetical protein